VGQVEIPALRYQMFSELKRVFHTSVHGLCNVVFDPETVCLPFENEQANKSVDL
jgi:hypothetical protein